MLVLSEFAGAAAELAEALQVNPYDIEGTAETYYRALTMPPDERRTRMRALRRRVAAYDVHRWAGTFLQRTGGRNGGGPASSPGSSPAATVEAVLRPPSLGGAPRAPPRLRRDARALRADPGAGRAGRGACSPSSARLAGRPGTEVHVVSGRTRETLEAWLGALPIGLHAEHGLWSRPLGAPDWIAPDLPAAGWQPAVLAILQDFAARTPGSLVEEKTASVAWHYRADRPGVRSQPGQRAPASPDASS